MTPFSAPQPLHDLAFRYALAVDNRDAELLINLFSSDGGVFGFGENPISYQGEVRLREMIDHVSDSFGRTMHNVFNQTFERSAEGTITGMTYCIASHIIEGDDWQVLDMPIRYHNSYVECDGTWRFHERHLEVLWIETRPVTRFDPAVMAPPVQRFR